MTITVEEWAYELTVRWRNNRLSGAHVGFELAQFKDGELTGVTPLPVMAVDIGSGKGFPLQDILTKLAADALIRVGELEAEVRKADETIAALRAEKATLSAASPANPPADP